MPTLRNRLAKLERRRTTENVGLRAIAHVHRMMFSYCEGSMPEAEAEHWLGVAEAAGMTADDHKLL